MKKINLPNLYSQELWERGGKNKRNKKYIGLPYISWSQLETFISEKGFNTGLKGKYEYMRKYFLKEKYEDMGWGAHGKSVEAYICLRNKKRGLSDDDKLDLEWAKKHFTQEGKELLKTIKPLGIFQYEICLYIEELNCIVLGYIDDMTKPDENNKIKTLRDYKTKSESSKKDLHKDNKHQLEIYTMALNQYGYIVENAEYVIIDRSGGRECMQGGGKEALNIGSQIWVEPYDKNRLEQERLLTTKNLIIDSIKEISEYYDVFNILIN